LRFSSINETPISGRQKAVVNARDSGWFRRYHQPFRDAMRVFLGCFRVGSKCQKLRYTHHSEAGIKVNKNSQSDSMCI
jgi:hypothetical protein